MSTSNMEFLFKCHTCKTGPLICTSGSLGLRGKQKGKKILEFYSLNCAYEARSRNMKLTDLKVNEIQDSSLCVCAHVCEKERRGLKEK